MDARVCVCRYPGWLAGWAGWFNGDRAGWVIGIISRQQQTLVGKRGVTGGGGFTPDRVCGRYLQPPSRQKSRNVFKLPAAAIYLVIDDRAFAREDGQSLTARVYMYSLSTSTRRLGLLCVACVRDSEEGIRGSLVVVWL